MAIIRPPRRSLPIYARPPLQSTPAATGSGGRDTRELGSIAEIAGNTTAPQPVPPIVQQSVAPVDQFQSTSQSPRQQRQAARRAAKQARREVRRANRAARVASRRRIIIDPPGGEINHYSAEGFAGEEFTGDASWQTSTICKIPAANLVAGEWLFVVHAFVGASTWLDTQELRLVEDDGTPTVMSYDRTVADSGIRFRAGAATSSLSSGVLTPFMVRRTVTGDSDVVVQMKNPVGTTGRLNHWRVLAIHLDELTEGTDYLWGHTDTDNSLDPADTWEDLGVAVSPSEGDDWLFFSSVGTDHPSGRQISTRFNIDSTMYDMDTQSSYDTNDEHNSFAAFIQESMPASTCALEGWVFNNVQTVTHASLFALRLNSFKDYHVGASDTPIVNMNLAGQEIITTTMSAATQSGNYLMFGSYKDYDGGKINGNWLSKNINAAGEVVIAGDETSAHYEELSLVNSTACLALWSVEDVTALDEVTLVLDAKPSGSSRDANFMRLLIMSMEKA